MTQAKLVKLEKIEVVKDPQTDTADWSDYNFGSENEGKSPPVEYTLEGKLLFDVKKFQSVNIFRTKRNDVVCGGLMRTTPLTNVIKKDDHFILTTLNSVYKLTEI